MICWLSGHRPRYIVRALQVKQYSNRPSAKVVCVSGGTKTFGRTLTQPGPDAFGMRHESGEYFAPNPMLSSINTDFDLKFEVKTKNIKKVFCRKILGYLITFT